VVNDVGQEARGAAGASRGGQQRGSKVDMREEGQSKAGRWKGGTRVVQRGQQEKTEMQQSSGSRSSDAK
jgi:hypothetical protein